MDRYTKKYIRYVNNIYNEKITDRHFPGRDSAFIIAKYGKDTKAAREKLSTELQGCLGLVAFQFFDKEYLVIDGLKYESEPHNYSGFIYFGDIVNISIPENGKLVEKRCCKVDGVSYVLRDEDMSYDEYVDKYNKEIESAKVLSKRK